MNVNGSKDVFLCFPANISYLAWVHSLFDRVADDYGFSLQRKHRLLVAVSEAFTNAIIHGSSQEKGSVVEVNITSKDGWLNIEVIDSGHGLSKLPPQSAWGRVSPDSEGGRGLDLMRGLSDKLEFSESPNGGLAVRLGYNISDNHPGQRAGTIVDKNITV
jgi:anti-sigma regulatory factor (Ser/Thr protein kinase)